MGSTGPAGLWPSSPSSPLCFLMLPGSLSRSPSLSVFHQLQVAAALVNPRRSSVDAPLAGSGPETGGSIHPRLSPVPFAASHTPLLVPEHGRLTGRLSQQCHIKPRVVVLVLVASPLSSSAQGDELLSKTSKRRRPSQVIRAPTLLSSSPIPLFSQYSLCVPCRRTAMGAPRGATPQQPASPAPASPRPVLRRRPSVPAPPASIIRPQVAWPSPSPSLFFLLFRSAPSSLKNPSPSYPCSLLLPRAHVDPPAATG